MRHRENKKRLFIDSRKNEFTNKQSISVKVASTLGTYGNPDDGQELLSGASSINSNDPVLLQPRFPEHEEHPEFLHYRSH